MHAHWPELNSPKMELPTVVVVTSPELSQKGKTHPLNFPNTKSPFPNNVLGRCWWQKVKLGQWKPLHTNVGCILYLQSRTAPHRNRVSVLNSKFNFFYSLFMAPNLMRAHGAYKDIPLSIYIFITFQHTHFKDSSRILFRWLCNLILLFLPAAIRRFMLFRRKYFLKATVRADFRGTQSSFTFTYPSVSYTHLTLPTTAEV